jgi:hypothetical protein
LVVSPAPPAFPESPVERAPPVPPALPDPPVEPPSPAPPPAVDVVARRDAVVTVEELVTPDALLGTREVSTGTQTPPCGS